MKKADKGDRERNPTWVDRLASEKKSIIRPVFYSSLWCMFTLSRRIHFIRRVLDGSGVCIVFLLSVSFVLRVAIYFLLCPSQRVSCIFKFPERVLISERNISPIYLILLLRAMRCFSPSFHLTWERTSNMYQLCMLLIYCISYLRFLQ